jgi:hypothetical protein
MTEQHEMKGSLSKYTAKAIENSRKEQLTGTATKNEMIHERVLNVLWTFFRVKSL